MRLSGVGKKVGDAALKAASESIIIDLKRRTNIANAGLTASKGINMSRMTNYLDFKARKGIADDSSTLMEKYSESMAVEKVAQAAFKASQILNWNNDPKRMTSENVEDVGFKPCESDYHRECFDDQDMYLSFLYCKARKEYVADAFEVDMKDQMRLAFYAENIFKIAMSHGNLFACHAIAIDTIVEAATNSLNELYALQNPRKELHAQQRETPTDHAAPFKFRFLDPNSLKLLSKIERSIYIANKYEGELLEHEEAGFMNSRDEMSIFMDSEECHQEVARVSRKYLPSSAKKVNLTRVIKFMEFKARKEYAMEMYGVKLGDYESLKEKAYKLFEINEAEAAMLASQTMLMDFENLVVEKIADAAFKTSKLLNWVSYNNEYPESPAGFLADAGFKSPKSLMNYHRENKAEACRAYTMETFGVDKVDIDYLKDYTLSCFAQRGFEEREAMIMACETIAIHKLFDDAFKALNSTFHNNQLVEPNEAEENEYRAMLGFGKVYPVYSSLHSPHGN